MDANGLVTAGTNGTMWVKAVSMASPALKDSVLVTMSGQAIAGTPRIIIYPNPARDFVYIRIAQAHPALFISLSDATGRLVFKKTVAANTFTVPQKIDLRNLTSGTYFFRIQGEGINEGKRLVKF